MPEIIMKSPETVSPVARNGGGDISELELTRERYTLQTTTPARSQPANPKKPHLPISKFTSASVKTVPRLQKIKSCLDEFGTPITTPKKTLKTKKAISMEDLTPKSKVKRKPAILRLAATAPHKITVGLKATSMEDLTPSKRRVNGRIPRRLPASPHNIAEDEAAARICRFMVLGAWRKRRSEVKCLKKTLEVQVSCSERLRIQVSTLKHLLDSDNCKVRLAMRELDRLKQLLKDKEVEKAVLEQEKMALEKDICAAEDRASDMSIGWHNTLNELEGTRAAMAVNEHALTMEKAASAELRSQRDRSYSRLARLEGELCQHEGLLSAAETEVITLNHILHEKIKMIEHIETMLKIETQEKEDSINRYNTLNIELFESTLNVGELNHVVGELRGEITRLQGELNVTREQLEWWPKSMTRLLGAARCWLRSPVSIPDAVIWTLLPARHGC